MANQFDRTKFFDGFRERLDPTISQEQVDGLEFLLSRMEVDPFWQIIPQMAYGLATVFHETAGSFQPVEEGYYLGSSVKVKAFQKTLRYYPYFGRGDVQLTWAKNYEKATKELKRQLPDLVAEYNAKHSVQFDLVAHPEQALDPLIAYAVLTLGMHQGWFGAKLEENVSATKKDYVKARHSVNGTDKAGIIAGYATSFEKILNASLITTSAAPALSSGDQTGLPENVPPPGEQTPPDGNQDTPPKSENVVEVPPVVTEKAEGIVTKVKGWYAALPAFVLSILGGFWSWLQGAATEIIVAFFASAGAVAMTYLIATFVIKNKREARQHEADEAQKQRDFELTKLQLQSAMDPNRQTVRIAPPVTEIPNIDGAGAGA